ncbi:hypothetical protein K9N68_00320 [Kovacikia minuta CCNUW1]|uniref:hypothetical protein n=1 Tax=Kovacikia minuta TaxID=2931930 RepID=UPI001CCF22EF|nr:hypothetical protein [Kovacikia minuta]UBF26495.1 hypothetical protein K9N68_00320 [Kovacikia minuta CCNUW1]
MRISRLHQLLINPIEKVAAGDRTAPVSASMGVWFGLSLGFAVFYGFLGLQKAFRSAYVVQDDAREYVFWMQRFIDPALFPQDLIADYFQSITPSGYAALYQSMATLGIPPLLLSKVLPLGLGLVATVYCFGVCLQIFPVPAAGFVSSLLLNQSLWFKSDLASATPKAFIYPLFLAFVYYLLRRSWVPLSVTIALEGWFYPPLVFISVGILALRLGNWRRFSPLLEPGQGYWWLCVVGLGIGVLTTLPYAVASAEFAPLVTAAQARAMPEFWAGGRHPYFNSNPWQFWLIGQHSGILPPLMPPLIWTGLVLPIILNHPSRFPLVKHIQPAIAILLQTVVASLGLFFAAHALLLKLFFPTRYTIHTFRMVMAIAAGIVLIVILDAVFRACTRMVTGHQNRRLGMLALTGVMAMILIAYPNFSPQFPATNNRISGEGKLYPFLQTQPKNTLVATLASTANNIPTFAQRSVLLSEEYALPFHLGYYNQIRQRSKDLIHAQYTPDLAIAQQFIQQYGINFWLVEHNAFTSDYLTKASWLKSFQPEFSNAIAQLNQGTVPAIAQLVKQCSVLETETLSVLAGNCISQVGDRIKS